MLPCNQVILSSIHISILSSVSLIVCKFFNLPIYQLVNLLAYKLVSFSVGASCELVFVKLDDSNVIRDIPHQFLVHWKYFWASFLNVSIFWHICHHSLLAGVRVRGQGDWKV